MGLMVDVCYLSDIFTNKESIHYHVIDIKVFENFLCSLFATSVSSLMNCIIR